MPWQGMSRSNKSEEVKDLVYSWKMNGLYPVPAQQAGEEIERICEKHGGATPKAIVDESRPEHAPLHPIFEWNEPVAAELWREQQARQIVCCLITVEQTAKSSEPVQVRAFHHARQAYHPMSVVVQSRDMMEEVKADALRSMLAFKQKYSVLSEKFLEVQRVIEAMDKAIPKLKDGLVQMDRPSV